METLERCQKRHSSVFVVNFEHILHLFLVFLLFNLSMSLFAEIAVILIYRKNIESRVNKLFLKIQSTASKMN